MKILHYFMKEERKTKKLEKDKTSKSLISHPDSLIEKCKCREFMLSIKRELTLHKKILVVTEKRALTLYKCLQPLYYEVVFTEAA